MTLRQCGCWDFSLGWQESIGIKKSLHTNDRGSRWTIHQVIGKKWWLLNKPMVRRKVWNANFGPFWDPSFLHGPRPSYSVVFVILFQQSCFKTEASKTTRGKSRYIHLNQPDDIPLFCLVMKPAFLFGLSDSLFKIIPIIRIKLPQSFPTNQIPLQKKLPIILMGQLQDGPRGGVKKTSQSNLWTLEVRFLASTNNVAVATNSCDSLCSMTMQR